MDIKGKTECSRLPFYYLECDGDMVINGLCLLNLSVSGLIPNLSLSNVAMAGSASTTSALPPQKMPRE